MAQKIITSENKARLSIQTGLEKQEYEQEKTLSSGASFDHRKTLKKINKHKRLRFEDCSDTDAVFWPLGFSRAPHFAKKLDVDTRHFRVEGYGDFNAYQAWATNIRFRKWSRDTGFALDLDDFGDALGDFGSCAVKLVEMEDGRFDLQEVDLMKLWFDPTIKNFKGQTKIELHDLEQHVVEGMKGWKNVLGEKGAWNMAERSDNNETEKHDNINTVASKRKFWERVGYYNVAHYKNEDLINGEYITNPEKNDWRFMHTIHSGYGDDEVVVYAEEISEDEDIYVDLHISKYEDRWMRIGVYERLFDLQKLINEAVNYDKETQRIASLLLIKSRNKKIVGSNIMQNAKSGLITDADLEQIVLKNPNYGGFINNLQTYERKADVLCMTPDVLTGEGSDAKTFRGQAALTNQASSAFKKARDRVSLVISEILIRRILPMEMKGWNKEKSLEISGFEVDNQVYDLTVGVQRLNNWIAEQHKSGRNPSIEEQDAFSRKLLERVNVNGRQLKLPKNFFDFKFGLGINATGETENKEQQNDAYFNVVNWVLNSQGAVNQIPAFREYVEKNNITPFHLSQQAIQALQQQRGPGQQVEQVGKSDRLANQIQDDV